MKPDGSLPHSHEPATCPCPEPDQPCPCPHHISWRYTLILLSHLHLGLPSRLFPSDFPTKPSTNLSSPLYALNLRAPFPNHLISFWSEWVSGVEKGLPVLENFKKKEQIHLACMFSSSVLYPRDNPSTDRDSSTNRRKIFYSLWCLHSFLFNGYRCLILRTCIPYVLHSTCPKFSQTKTRMRNNSHKYVKIQNTVWFKNMDSISYVYISWTIHGMWMIYITLESGGPKFSNTTARALA
jgi:hypothetical protein